MGFDRFCQSLRPPNAAPGNSAALQGRAAFSDRSAGGRPNADSPPGGRASPAPVAAHLRQQSGDANAGGPLESIRERWRGAREGGRGAYRGSSPPPLPARLRTQQEAGQRGALGPLVDVVAAPPAREVPNQEPLASQSKA